MLLAQCSCAGTLYMVLAQCSCAGTLRMRDVVVLHAVHRFTWGGQHHFLQKSAKFYQILPFFALKSAVFPKLLKNLTRCKYF